MNIQEVRAKFPQYNDLDDQQLAKALHSKYYSDMPYADFATKVGLVPARNEAAAKFRDSIPGMFGGRNLPDMAMGARQVWDAAAQFAARGAESIANKFGGSETLTKMREDTEAVNKDALAQYTRNFDPDNTPMSSLARGAGQAIATAPLALPVRAAGAIKSALAGSGLGAASSALTPVYDAPDEAAFWAEKAKQTGAGAAFGAATGGILGAIGRTAPSAQSKALADAGVRVTPGRSAGGATQRLEEGAESIPIVGDMIRGKHLQAVQDFNRATFDKVLEPIGEKLAPGVLGRQAVKETRKKISAAYESALDQIRRVDLDKQFSDEGTKVAGMTAELGESAQKQFRAILKNRVFDKITPAGTMSAETMKAVDSDLGRLAWNYKKSQDPNMQGLGDAIFEIQGSLRRNVERSAGPELAGKVRAANAAWAQWVRVADASSRAGSKEGIFSPAALRGAVAKADKRKFREGGALMQKWAEDAEAVLGPKVPDSGTPYRLAGMSGLGGMLLDPSIAVAGGAMMLPYTNVGMRAANALAGQADKAAAVAPYLGLLAAPALAGTR